MTTIAGRPADRVQLFGAEVDALTFDQSMDEVFRLVDDPRPSQHVVLNAAKVVQMERDPKLLEIISSCDLVNADGISVVWASRMLGTPLPHRVTGIDLFAAILDRAATTGHSVYFLGATEAVLDRLVERYTNEFPSLKIAGYRDGYWDEDGVEAVVEDVRAANPDFLFLAIPSPRKEFWLHEHLHELNVPFVMGVGGSFDVMAGQVKRAPGWVQQLGCEWLYRLSQEPGRMWKRYLVGNSRFLGLTLRARIRQGLATQA